ncbi:low molecular weight protein-tyrosine-phosphatase [Nitrosomonas supralitoralis]|uniref:protein-tyrosine-phosphatase n=1 Tax=Nitrosomonas supralitoralis TaxID=2116706 RepID=A0A2P7NWW8_9PROT|nr:low molecular weight protein-tyrosine-phosphatase [Nitrosomonas supralitoralis]PSJ17960.1 low molecular weight phosphotyrosine protein phosphatase [Nitrosomonas supralitoralis]
MLVVCVGNICRSPMAEGLFKQTFIEAGKSECRVSSAGLSALVGHAPDPNACQLMINKGIDISAYRACQLNQEMIRRSELILVMELSQKQTIEANEPTARGKIFRLGEWGNFDIADPYQKEMHFFERTFSLIEEGVSQWMGKL